MKDLRVLFEGRRPKSVVLVDNRAVSFARLHLCNGLPIKDYSGDKTDSELRPLTDYILSHLLLAEDVRTVIKRDFQLGSFIPQSKPSKKGKARS